MKTYVYARVSTEKQTLAQQLNSIEDYLRPRGLKIDELVSDEGVSGGVSYKHRKLAHLVAEMSEGDALVVSEISRLGRSMADLNMFVHNELKPRKLRLIVVSMGLDLDCSNIKAIDEMILFSFSFAAQIEKEVIQERTRNGLAPLKKQLKEKGYFISKKGNYRTSLGGGNTEKAIIQSAKNRVARAKANPTNVFFYNYVMQFEKRNGRLDSRDKEGYQRLADELNGLGQKTVTGLPYTKTRCQGLVIKMRKRFRC